MNVMTMTGGKLRPDGDYLFGRYGSVDDIANNFALWGEAGYVVLRYVSEINRDEVRKIVAREAYRFSQHHRLDVGYCECVFGPKHFGAPVGFYLLYRRDGTGRHRGGDRG